MNRFAWFLLAFCALLIREHALAQVGSNAAKGVQVRGFELAPRPLPPEIVKAWTQVGAECGRMKIWAQTYAPIFEPGKGAEVAALPAFRFCTLVKGALAGLPDLRETMATDVGLRQLALLKSLGRVWLHDTKVTKAGVAEFQKALPECKIDR